MPRQTGPKTPQGKATVKYNALRHGILSESPVLPNVESEEDWHQFRDSIFESLQPQGGLEGALADRVAALLWRLARIVRYERESVANSQSHIHANVALAYRIEERPLPDAPDVEWIERVDNQLMATLIPDEDTLNKIMRYETRLHRHLLQTLHQLSLIKGFRQTLPHNSKHGIASLDAPGYKRNKPALPQGPSLSTPT